MAGLIWILLSACLLGCTSQVSLSDQKYITAESGQDVILTCRAPKYNGQTLQWSRADLGDEYVLLHRNGRIDLGNPHPSFVNRVALQDRQMKDGDVSLILKNVTINDTGTYKCGVFINGTNDPISIIYLSVVDPPDQKSITADSGEDVTLTCRAPTNNIDLVEWSRADLTDKFVLVYQGDHFRPDEQHPSFKNRVDLQDRQVKDGDVSLILKNVTINDTGTYECRVMFKETHSLELINSINLTVDPPGQTGGGREGDCVVLIACLLVSGVLVVAAVAGFVIYRNHKKAKEVLTKLLNSSKYLRPLIIKQSPAAVPTSQCCQ